MPEKALIMSGDDYDAMVTIVHGFVWSDWCMSVLDIVLRTSI